MRVRSKDLETIGQIKYHDVIKIRLFHLDGYGIVDSIDLDSNIITFSKLFTARVASFDWTNDVADNIQFAFNPDQMSFCTLLQFINQAINHRFFDINDVITIGDYICPDVFSIVDRNQWGQRTGSLILAKIKEVELMRFGEVLVQFDTRITVGQPSTGFKFLGIREPTQYSKYYVTNSALQFRATDYDLTSIENVLDFMIRGEVL